MKNLMLAVISMTVMVWVSGCASVGAHIPRATVYTNVPFLGGYDVIKAYNSAGPTVVLVPQSRGDGFVAEYRYEKGSWKNLWIFRKRIPTKLVTLANGQSMTLPLYRNTTRYAVQIPFAVAVYERGKFIGFYTECYRVYPNRNNSYQFNFGKKELQALKRGYTGRTCNNYGGGYY